jgi:hypothetical protein
MKRVDRLEPEFVEEIPVRLLSGKLYVSIIYGTALHLCCCGCGSEVVTPIHPTRWAFSYDGESISLHPSVGNWSLPCRSHYIVEKGRVRWAAQWSRAKIEAGRARERRDSSAYFAPETASPGPPADRDEPDGDGILGRLRRRWKRPSPTRVH